MSREVMLEAVCNKCGNTFIPDSETDLTHHWDEERGINCGGEGELMGAWVFPPLNTEPHELGGMTMKNGELSDCETCGCKPGELHTEEECFK